MIPASSLLYPRWRGLVNRARSLDSNGWGWVLGSAGLIAAVWVGLFIGIRELLEACYRIELFDGQIRAEPNANGFKSRNERGSTGDDCRAGVQEHRTCQ